MKSNQDSETRAFLRASFARSHRHFGSYLRATGECEPGQGGKDSCGSGIPTFRNPQDGLWAQYDPEELASVRGFRKNPNIVMEWYAWRRSLVLKAQPNPAHMILAHWGSQFPDLTLITQNVDGLHTASGSQNVLEMHGSIHRLKCFDNGHPCNWPLSASDKMLCEVCGSLLRPDIIWFGETLASDVLSKVYQAVKRCELFLAIGTSALVYPAAGLLDEAKQSGAITLVINPDPSARGSADHFLQETASGALTILNQTLHQK